MKEGIRSWSSICADCALFQTARCPAPVGERRPDDCIATICAEFTTVPAEQDPEMKKREIPART